MELKNTCRAHKKGHWAEGLVKSAFLSWKWELLIERWQTPFAEVDLVFVKDHKLMMVEVKTLSNYDLAPYRLSLKQKNRLIRAHSWLQSHDFEVQLLLVLVGQDRRLHFLAEF